MTSVLSGVYELIVGYQSIGKGRFTAPSRLVHCLQTMYTPFAWSGEAHFTSLSRSVIGRPWRGRMDSKT